MSICNTESPVRQLGFFGSEQEGLFALSTVETASCWHFPSSQRIGQFPSIREDFGVDYLVDCWGSVSDPNGLFMAVGYHSGQVQVCSVDPSGLTPLWSLPASSDISLGGHSDTVRCCEMINRAPSGAGVLLTAGEDSTICMWQVGDGVASGAVTEKRASAGDELEDDGSAKRRRRI